MYLWISVSSQAIRLMGSIAQHLAEISKSSKKSKCFFQAAHSSTIRAAGTI
jgi:hypothetical protein